jgi:hypothetical protein
MPTTPVAKPIDLGLTELCLFRFVPDEGGLLVERTELCCRVRLVDRGLSPRPSSELIRHYTLVFVTFSPMLLACERSILHQTYLLGMKTCRSYLLRQRQELVIHENIGLSIPCTGISDSVQMHLPANLRPHLSRLIYCPRCESLKER